jgi:hypothetical protein
VVPSLIDAGVFQHMAVADASSLLSPTGDPLAIVPALLADA